MKSRVATFALFCSLAASLAFAGESPKSSSNASGAQPLAEAKASDTAAQVPCTDQHGNSKKVKVKTQPAQSQQEKEFEHMLMGIFG